MASLHTALANRHEESIGSRTADQWLPYEDDNLLGMFIDWQMLDLASAAPVLDAADDINLPCIEAAIPLADQRTQSLGTAAVASDELSDVDMYHTAPEPQNCNTNMTATCCRSSMASISSKSSSLRSKVKSALRKSKEALFGGRPGSSHEGAADSTQGASSVSDSKNPMTEYLSRYLADNHYPRPQQISPLIDTNDEIVFLVLKFLSTMDALTAKLRFGQIPMSSAPTAYFDAHFGRHDRSGVWVSTTQSSYADVFTKLQARYSALEHDIISGGPLHFAPHSAFGAGLPARTNSCQGLSGFGRRYSMHSAPKNIPLSSTPPSWGYSNFMYPSPSYSASRYDPNPFSTGTTSLGGSEQGSHFSGMSNASKKRRFERIENAYGCPNCSRSFDRACDRDKHWKNVHGERPDCCHVCPDKAFVQDKDLRRHLENVHGIYRDNGVDIAAPTNNNNADLEDVEHSIPVY